MGNREDPRLIARVARLYYEKKIRQSEIAEQLGLSQAVVSRLLSLGEKEGIIKVVVQIPRGVYIDMEERLAAKFHLKDVVIADCSVDRESPAMIREIGTCAASYVESILRPNDVIGLSSWSTALLAMVDETAESQAMRAEKALPRADPPAACTCSTSGDSAATTAWRSA